MFTVRHITVDIVEAIKLVFLRSMFRVPQIMADCANAIQRVLHEGIQGRIVMRRSWRNSGWYLCLPYHRAWRKIAGAVLKFVHVDVDTFNLWWVYRWSRAPCCFHFSVCARDTPVQMCCESRISFYLACDMVILRVCHHRKSTQQNGHPVHGVPTCLSPCDGWTTHLVVAGCLSYTRTCEEPWCIASPGSMESPGPLM